MLILLSSAVVLYHICLAKIIHVFVKNSTFELDMLLICFIIYNDVLYFADDFYVLMLYLL